MKAIVLLSGGLDSTVCLYWAREQYDEVEAMIFDYGQRHRIEVGAALRIAREANVAARSYPTGLLKDIGRSGLLDGTGDYECASTAIVTNRNAFFLVLAHGLAQTEGAQAVVTGFNFDDHEDFPDCRREFLGHLNEALNLGAECSIKLLAPLAGLPKEKIFGLAKSLRIPEHVIAMTHTCYRGVVTLHEWGNGCGECAACRSRQAGYEKWSAMWGKK